MHNQIRKNCESKQEMIFKSFRNGLVSHQNMGNNFNIISSMTVDFKYWSSCLKATLFYCKCRGLIPFTCNMYQIYFNFAASSFSYQKRFSIFALIFPQVSVSVSFTIDANICRWANQSEGQLCNNQYGFQNLVLSWNFLFVSFGRYPESTFWNISW